MAATAEPKRRATPAPIPSREPLTPEALVERIDAADRQDKFDATRNYRDLVERVADGRDFAEHAGQAVDALRDAKKTTEDLRADVETMRQRKEWAAQVAAGKAAEGEKAEAWAEVVRLKAEAKETLERLTKEFHDRIRAAEGRHQESLFAIEQAYTARRQLLGSAPPLAGRRLHQLRHAAMPELSHEIAGKKVALESARATLRVYEEAIEAKRPPLNKTMEEAADDVERMTRDVGRQEAAIRSLEDRHAALAAEADTLDAACVEPWHESCPTLR